MSLTELFPDVMQLPRADKFRLMQFLVAELAREDGVSLLVSGAEYPIWTPLDAFEAAETLMQMLGNHRTAAS